ncbi:MAG: DNA-directed RNA polymerase subunit L [Methanimicrococcus sp.]|nr:DNA-directed RNA polymerase subunit L [Methanimicrococcus sp.]MCL2142619.1 DNA-directed RNA polymerase subunit L [Methanimicrococcus sp.]
MEITILSQGKDEMEILVKGETHTLMNIIKAALIEDPRVETAFYDVKRLSNSVERQPVLYMKTMPGEKPLAILKDVTDKIVKMCDDFSDAFAKAARQK